MTFNYATVLIIVKVMILKKKNISFSYYVIKVTITSKTNTQRIQFKKQIDQMHTGLFAYRSKHKGGD